MNAGVSGSLVPTVFDLKSGSVQVSLGKASDRKSKGSKPSLISMASEKQKIIKEQRSKQFEQLARQPLDRDEQLMERLREFKKEEEKTNLANKIV